MLSRLTFNVEQIGTTASDSLVMMVRTALTIALLLGYALYLNYRLTVLALVLGPLFAWIVSRINQYFRRYSRRIRIRWATSRACQGELRGATSDQDLQCEEHLGRQFGAVNERNRRSNMRMILTKGLSTPIVQTVSSLGLAFVLSLAIAAAIHHQMTMGDLAAFMVALIGISQPLQQFVGVSGNLQQGIAAAQNLFELLTSRASRTAAASTWHAFAATSVLTTCRSRMSVARARR